MPKYQTLNGKVDDIYSIFVGGLVHSNYFLKYLRISLTEQKTVRNLPENQLRQIYHYQSSNDRIKHYNEKAVESHAVPVKVIADILVDQFTYNRNNFTKEFITHVLERLLWVVFITKEEQAKLNSNGLRQQMPKNWDWEKDSPYIRFEINNIQVNWNK